MKLTDLGYETLSHQSYSSDLSPTDHHFFQHLDTFICGKTFCSKDTKTAFGIKTIRLLYKNK